MVKEVKGDIIKLFKDNQFDIMIHGCNCFNSMGAGLAKQIALNYPSAVAADNKTAKGDIHKLGDFTTAKIVYKDELGNKVYKWIYNLYTQYTPGPDFKLFVLESCLWKLTRDLNSELSIGFTSFKIATPYIGAGIGGGDWKEIKALLIKYLDKHDLTIVEFDPFS
jgi:O-acetyl-ADP-ribose deacetylase (regulator of RNase III)